MTFHVLYINRGPQSRTRFLDVGKVARILGHNTCDTLVGVHAFTGCDIASAFADRGKKEDI